MQGSSTYLSLSEMAEVFGIHPHTLEALVYSGTIPHTYIGDRLRFNPYVVSEWMQSKPVFNIGTKSNISNIRSYFQKSFKSTMQELKGIDSQISPKEGKTHYLHKVKNKKHGFLYYVRYKRGGKTVASRWNTHTNNKALADKFAEENRQRLLSAYDETNSKALKETNFYKTLRDYYKEASAYLEEDIKRGRSLSERVRKQYEAFIKEKAIPFFKRNGALKFSDITPPLIAKLQTHLLQNNRPQTVNKCLSCLRSMFNHFTVKGIIAHNAFKDVSRLNAKNAERPRGCYDIEMLNGIFRSKWKDELSYLLCLVIYTTGLRNSEIDSLKRDSLCAIKNCYFLNITKSKTPSGLRLVPLHPLVCQKLLSFCKKHSIAEESYIFRGGNKKIAERCFTSANLTLGEKLGYSAERLTEENITFYSGRHFWKTLMNAYGLGDTEEYFMGHKVGSDISKRYNHRDKQGQKLLLKKASHVFSILDKTLLKV